MTSHDTPVPKPSQTYLVMTYVVAAIGLACYLVGLFNADIQLNEKGYYLAIYVLAMFSTVALQKSIRDKEDGLDSTSNSFITMSWCALAAAVAFLLVGLFNANMALSEKGFYGVTFIMSLFALMSAQKAKCDNALSEKVLARTEEPEQSHVERSTV